METNPNSGAAPLVRFLKRWFTNTVAVLVAANVIRGITYDGWASLLAASLLLGVLNALVRPLLMVLSLPLIILTLGFFTLIINALLLYFVGSLIKAFHVETFWAAFWGGLVISLVTFLLNQTFGLGEPRTRFRDTSRARHGPPPPPPGSGPIIDV